MSLNLGIFFDTFVKNRPSQIVSIFGFHKIWFSLKHFKIKLYKHFFGNIFLRKTFLKSTEGKRSISKKMQKTGGTENSASTLSLADAILIELRSHQI